MGASQVSWSAPLRRRWSFSGTASTRVHTVSGCSTVSKTPTVCVFPTSSLPHGRPLIRGLKGVSE
jgi:hypothetical protein